MLTTICKLIGHRIDRRRVWNDDYDYRTTCRRCGAELIRDAEEWRTFDPLQDGNVPRREHIRHTPG